MILVRVYRMYDLRWNTGTVYSSPAFLGTSTRVSRKRTAGFALGVATAACRQHDGTAAGDVGISLADGIGDAGKSRTLANCMHVTIIASPYFQGSSASTGTPEGQVKAIRLATCCYAQGYAPAIAPPLQRLCSTRHVNNVAHTQLTACRGTEYQEYQKGKVAAGL